MYLAKSSIPTARRGWPLRGPKESRYIPADPEFAGSSAGELARVLASTGVRPSYLATVAVRHPAFGYCIRRHAGSGETRSATRLVACKRDGGLDKYNME